MDNNTFDWYINACQGGNRPCNIPGHGWHCNEVEEELNPNGYGNKWNAALDELVKEMLVSK